MADVTLRLGIVNGMLGARGWLRVAWSWGFSWKPANSRRLFSERHGRPGVEVAGLRLHLLRPLDHERSVEQRRRSRGRPAIEVSRTRETGA